MKYGLIPLMKQKHKDINLVGFVNQNNNLKHPKEGAFFSCLKVGERMAINAGSVYSELILNGDKYFSTLNKADKEMQSFEKKLKGYGDKLEKKQGKG